MLKPTAERAKMAVPMGGYPATPTRIPSARSTPAATPRGLLTPRSLLPMASNVDVYVRVRPKPTRDARAAGTATVHDDLRNLTVRLASARAGPLGMGRTFGFDRVFGESSTQDDIFNEVAAPLVDSVLDGYNAVCFAYGQTGSGKTFTMHGPSSGDARGLMARSVERLFDSMRQRASSGARYSVSCSLLQLYQEIATDCLSRGRGPLRIREDEAGKTSVEGLRHEPISSLQDAMRIIAIGGANRVVASTSQNAESSRSHAVFTLRVTVETPADTDTGEDSTYCANETSAADAGLLPGAKRVRTCALHLVDLAGSERQKDTNASGTRLREACSINKSLSALGNVISALSTSAPRVHVPYRDSKLTLLLRDALGGDARTAVIATVSPLERCFAETLSTLHFAQRAKLVKNLVAPAQATIIQRTPPRPPPPPPHMRSVASAATAGASTAAQEQRPRSAMAAAAAERFQQLVMAPHPPPSDLGELPEVSVLPIVTPGPLSTPTPLHPYPSPTLPLSNPPPLHPPPLSTPTPVRPYPGAA